MPKLTKAGLARQFNQFLEEVVLDFLLTDYANPDSPDKWRKHSARHIQDRYGLACAKLFRLIFVHWQRGGCSKDGRGFKTIWRLDKDVALDLRDVLEVTRHYELRNAQDVLDLLLSKGHKQKERVFWWVDDMKMVDVLEVGEELNEFKALKKYLRSVDKQRLAEETERTNAVHF
jgi:hypothetical protein